MGPPRRELSSRDSRTPLDIRRSSWGTWFPDFSARPSTPICPRASSRTRASPDAPLFPRGVCPSWPGCPPSSRWTRSAAALSDKAFCPTLLPPIWAGSVHPWSDLLRDPARHRAVVPPGGADRSADRPATDDGLHPRAFERVAHRGGVRSDPAKRGLPSPLSSVVVANGRAHEAIVRHVDRRRARPNRRGGPHERHAHVLVIGQSVAGRLCPCEPVARNPVGRCGRPQARVRPLDLSTFSKGPSTGGTRGQGALNGARDATG